MKMDWIDPVFQAGHLFITLASAVHCTICSKFPSTKGPLPLFAFENLSSLWNKQKSVKKLFKRASLRESISQLPC